MTKRCTACQRDLPLDREHFPAHKGHRDGFGSQCKSCKAQRDTVYRQQHLEEARARDHAYYEAHRERLLAPKSHEHLDPQTAMKVCSKCHRSKPLLAFNRKRSNVDGRRAECRDCQQDDQAIYMSQGNNRERAQQRLRQYTLEHQEEERVRLRDYKRANKEKMRQAKQRYVAENHGRILQQQRQHRADNLEDIRAYQRAWMKAHPEVGRLAQAKRRARQAGLPDTLTAEEVFFCYQYWQGACAVCGKEEGLFGLKLVLDHWVALADPASPGTVAPNMVVLCDGPGSCNQSKLHTPVLQWLTRRFGPRKARQILRKVEVYFAVVRAREQERPSDIAI